MDADEIHRLATQAKELKDDPAFAAAILALRKQWFGELMVSKEPTIELVYKLRALEALPQQLQIFLNDWAMQQRKHNV